ncbi:rod shape-determining protein MreD [Neobacillus ginsengisoli]|uniref:Rod shape-determining protein MreD n=1 Tax=Neobacillus ginsengisoli TaxID=904295 RepID=A0ABT9XNK8_9BACI|nr:rod shape-determining protein MreD [Neobacillus ginsengisoli]MDQ0197135.1 rod shape-determining protein MreD [Neobacillus ginsengisoli]
MKKFLLPLLFLILFLMESLFAQYLPGEIFGRTCVPHFLFIGLLFLTIYVGKKQGIIYGFIFGILFDIVNTEILGIYMFLFPFVAYLVSKFMNVMHANIITVFLSSLIGIALLEVGVYEMNVLIHVTDMDYMTFFKMRFYPTLIFNAVFIILAGYPLKRQFEKIAAALRDD